MPHRPFLLLALSVCATSLAAQPTAPVMPVTATPQDDRLLTQPLPTLRQQAPIGRPSGASAGGEQANAPLPQVTDEDLQANRPLAEHVINTAMLREDWDTLERVMQFYPQMEGADAMLVDFVQGALARRAGRHHEAITRYRRMLAHDPTLSYVRLDLAAMLLENKAYRDAGEALQTVLRDMRLVPAARHSALQYQQALAARQGWSGNLTLGHEWTSNVQNASDNRFLYLPIGQDENGKYYFWEMEKDAKDLPRSAHGFNVAGHVGREFNLRGNHFLTLGAGGSAAQYRNASDYNETAVNARAGWRWQDIRSWYAITPNVNQMWLGGDSYSRSWGISAEHGRWLGARWQVSGTYSWLERSYSGENYRNYEGNIHALSLSLVRVMSPDWWVFGALAMQDENARGGEESSLRQTVQAGAVKNFGNGLSSRASVRYTRRRFGDPYQLFLLRLRHDDEYGLDASLWQRHWQVAGFTPKINFSYSKVNSNLYAYDRDEKQLALTLERAF